MRTEAGWLRPVAAAILLLAAAPSRLYAQAAEDRPVRRIEVSGAFGVLGGAALGAADANLRANSLEARPYRLFATESRWTGAPLAEARVSFSLTRRYAVEGTFARARPERRSALSSDAEGAPDIEVAERVDRYLIDGGLVVMLDGLRLGGLVPTVGGGVGYLRQLHEGRTLVEEGHYVHAGAGARYWLASRPGGWWRALGLRADVRLAVIGGGAAAGDDRQRHGMLSGGVFVVF